MRRSLQNKMIGSYLAVALLTVVVASALIWLMSGQSLLDLVQQQQTAQLSQTVQDYYSAHGSLDGFADYYLHFSGPGAPPGTGGGSTKPPKDRELRGVLVLADSSGQVLLPTPGYDLGTTAPASLLQRGLAVTVDGATVAWIVPDTRYQFKLSPEEQAYRQRITLAIALAALVGVLAAVTMGSFLAGRLLRPIQQLTRASRALSQGDLRQQVPVTSRDELGQLTSTFNQMSQDLARADDERKRLTADITHDLSTPLQIIAGYMEMLEDGEVTLSPQRLEIIKTEIGHLRRLVGDLTTLAQVEAGGMDLALEPVVTGLLLNQVAQAYQPIAAQRGIVVDVEGGAAGEGPALSLDSGRMTQVLKNLIENSLRHTPSGGRVTLGWAADTAVRIFVRDTGEGIASEDLPYVFDRFYRADKAREGNSGKMGLGLAICKALVTAQGGTIRADSPGSGLGTTVTLTFPPPP